MQTFRTTGCAKHGHREVTLQFTDKPVIPNGERLLVSYFEDSVARGTQLPIESVVLVRDDEATVFHAGEQLTPQPGSYLEMLNSRSAGS